MEKLFATLILAAAATAGTTSPRDVVQTSVTRVLTIVAEQPDAGGRPDAIERRRVEMRRVAAEIFDFEEMARRALSRHWSGRTRAEQAEFVELFTDLLERTYVARIESYAGEKITYPNEIVDGEYATVRSRITTRRRAETTLDYRLHLADGKRWKVFDISVDGVSFVATYRSEIDALARKVDRPEPVKR
jgi:phospholipid transport system substrate-binding protein